METLPGELVLIPGDQFQMGVGEGKDHSPVHRVSIGTFLIGKCEVTNAQYLQFCHATGHRLPAFWGIDRFRSGPRYPEHPVVGVSWFDAGDFAAWNGMRLPTEAEWEYAARGGLAGRNYPNGDALEARDGNFAGSDKGGPVAVGSYPANGYGLHDMQGNVVEWVQDYYDAQYYALSPVMNPGGPESADARPEAVRFRVIRGGGWHSGKYCSRVYYRNALPGNWLDFNVGFRCARDVQAPGDDGTAALEAWPSTQANQ